MGQANEYNLRVDDVRRRSRRAVELVREMYKKAREEGVHPWVWDLITATRGPDNQGMRKANTSDRALPKGVSWMADPKEEFTIPIRQALGMISFCPKDVARLETIQRLYKEALNWRSQLDPEGYRRDGHYIQHILSALVALRSACRARMEEGGHEQ